MADNRDTNARPDEWDMTGVRDDSAAHAHERSHDLPERKRHHSSGSGSRRRRRRRTVKSFVRSHRWTIVNIAVVIFFSIAIVVLLTDETAKRADLVQTIEMASLETDTARLDTVSVGDGISFSAPYFESDPVLICDAAMAYLNGNEDRLAVHEENVDPTDEERPVTLRFSLVVPDGLSVEGYTVEVSENSDFSDARVIGLTGLYRSTEVNYLKTDTAYFYRITAALSDGGATAVTGSFRTADTPRILSIDGLSNVRDIGGWKTEGGSELRQGSIIRGSEAVYRSDESEARAESMALLGFRTELDLREGEGSAAEVFETDIQHLHCEAPLLSECYSAEGMEAVRAVISVLSDEENYPIYVHCTDGVERTGTVCCLLEAFLGMEREDIVMEYALSSPYEAEALEAEAAALLDGLNAYEGTTLSQRAESYLLACGLTDPQLQSIRDILLSGQ